MQEREGFRMKRWWMAVAVIAALMVSAVVVKAQAAAPAGGINGKWHFALDTPGGERDVEAEFTADADGKVTGTWGKDNVAGTFKDGKLDLAFQFTSEEAGETSQMKVMGILDDKGTITGNRQFSSYDGTFTAFHPKE